VWKKSFAESEHAEIFRCEETSTRKGAKHDARPRQIKRISGQTRNEKSERGGRKWSHKVTERSDPPDLRKGVFKLNDPKKIADSLKRSAERSKRRKADPYRSSQSMLTFSPTAPANAFRPAARRRWTA
jgi:hypothetical protein